MVEIERKFLVNPEKWTPVNKGTEIKQGYLSADKNRTVRVRIAGDLAFITIKGESRGISRTEYEYEIPKADAQVLLTMCLSEPIEKTRYLERVDNAVWEIDVFEGVNKGLILAEIELENESQNFTLPGWVGEEVSTDRRYFNSFLSLNPFTKW